MDVDVNITTALAVETALAVTGSGLSFFSAAAEILSKASVRSYLENRLLRAYFLY